MTDENKIPMEDIIDQAKEGLDEQETIGQTEDSKHQDSQEEIQEEDNEQTKENSIQNTDATPILKAITTAEKIAASTSPPAKMKYKRFLIDSVILAFLITWHLSVV